MRTLEEFQKEVLAPLREERDKKHAAALEIKTKAGAEFMKHKKDINFNSIKVRLEPSYSIPGSCF